MTTIKVRINQIENSKRYKLAWTEDPWLSIEDCTLCEEEVVELLGTYGQYFKRADPYTVIIFGAPATIQENIWYGEMPLKEFKNYMKRG